MLSVGLLSDQLDVWIMRLPPRVEALVAATGAWRTQRRSYCNLRRQKHEEFWTRAVVDNRSSLCELWRSINTLLGRGGVNVGDEIRSDQFHQFVVDTVAAIWHQLK